MIFGLVNRDEIINALNLTIEMKNMKLILMVVFLIWLSSCSLPGTHIYVWNMKDIIGLWIGGGIIIIILLVFAYALVSDEIIKWKRKSRK